MAQRIVIKRSSVSGRVPTGLSAGELAVNMNDRKLYTADTGGTVFELSNVTTSAVIDPAILTKANVANSLLS